MTTIATTVSSNYASIYSDQGITSDLIHPEMNKIVRQGTWLIGVCGDDRACDVVQYATKFPKVPDTLIGKPIEEWYPWIVTKVITQIQNAIQEHLHKDNWNLGESSVLLVTHGHSFLVSETLGVVKAEPYWAIGSGSQLAMGALSQKRNEADWRTSHGDYAKQAVEVAEIHDPFTRGKVSGYKSYPTGKITEIK